MKSSTMSAVFAIIFVISFFSQKSDSDQSFILFMLSLIFSLAAFILLGFGQ